MFLIFLQQVHGLDIDTVCPCTKQQHHVSFLHFPVLILANKHYFLSETRFFSHSLTLSSRNGKQCFTDVFQIPTGSCFMIWGMSTIYPKKNSCKLRYPTQESNEDKSSFNRDLTFSSRHYSKS